MIDFERHCHVLRRANQRTPLQWCQNLKNLDTGSLKVDN
jgi:hypothetical protein